MGGFGRYARSMRYAQGGGLTAEGRRRREMVRLAAVERFEQRVPVPEIAAELRVSERSVARWGGAGVGRGRGSGRAGWGGSTRPPESGPCCAAAGGAASSAPAAPSSGTTG